MFYFLSYIDIYIRVSLRGLNLGTFYVRKLKFGTDTYPDLNLQRYGRVAPG